MVVVLNSVIVESKHFQYKRDSMSHNLPERNDELMSHFTKAATNVCFH